MTVVGMLILSVQYLWEMAVDFCWRWDLRSSNPAIVGCRRDLLLMPLTTFTCESPWGCTRSAVSKSAFGLLFGK